MPLIIPCDTDIVSDGFHTFGELYAHRTALFPQHHAWLVDRANGIMFDTTYTYPYAADCSLYLGVAFKPEFVLSWVKAGDWLVGNIFDDHELDFPVERGIFKLPEIILQASELPLGCLAGEEEL